MENISTWEIEGRNQWLGILGYESSIWQPGLLGVHLREQKWNRIKSFTKDRENITGMSEFRIISHNPCLLICLHLVDFNGTCGEIDRPWYGIGKQPIQ